LALVRCALFSYCSDKIIEEHGDLLEALSEPHSSFPDKPAEWFYRATYRLLAGKVEKVGAEHWLVKGPAGAQRHLPPGTTCGSTRAGTGATASPEPTAT